MVTNAKPFTLETMVKPMYSVANLQPITISTKMMCRAHINSALICLLRSSIQAKAVQQSPTLTITVFTICWAAMFTEEHPRMVQVRQDTAHLPTDLTATVAMNAKPTLKEIMTYTMYTVANLHQEMKISATATPMAIAMVTPTVTATAVMPTVMPTEMLTEMPTAVMLTEMACRVPP